MIQSYLTFIRKTLSEKSEYNLLGLNEIENLSVLYDFNLTSGQPIVCCISNKKIIIDTILPTRGSKQSAGYDFYSKEQIV